MNVIISSIDQIINFGKANSLHPLIFGTSCCGKELVQTDFTNCEISKLGIDTFQNSPKQADLLICTGVITKKMAPALVNLYLQIPEPKYVIALGTCAISGGMFSDSYNVIQGTDSILPVDVYLPGCPPEPEALIDAITKLKNGIKNDSILKRKKELEAHYIEIKHMPNNVKGLNIEYFGVGKL